MCMKEASHEKLLHMCACLSQDVIDLLLVASLALSQDVHEGGFS